MKQENIAQEPLEEGQETEQNETIHPEATGDDNTEKQEVSEANEAQTSAGWEEKYLEANDKFLRLYSEFDNFRRRNAKERLELIKTAGSDIITAMLPIMDDFERAIKAMNEAEESDAVKEGIGLIYNKLKNTLQSKGVEAMDCLGKEFDADLHEAITNIPASDENMKGKVMDEVEKGYLLGGKVIRYAKVVVGA